MANRSAGVEIGATLNRSYSRSFKSANDTAVKLGKTLRDSRLGLTAAKNLSVYKARLDALKKSQKSGRVVTDAFNKKLAETQRQFDRAERAAKKYGITADNVTRRQRALAKSAFAAERGIGRLQRRQKIGGRLRRGAAIGVGAGLGLAYAGRGKLGFERESVFLRTVLNAKDKDDALARSKAHAKRFSQDGLTSAEDMLRIQYALNSGGLSAGVSRVGSAPVAKVATLTRGLPQQVGSLMTTVFNTMGDQFKGAESEKLGRIGDLLTQTQFKYQFDDFAQLGESLKTAVPALIGQGMDLSEGLVLLGRLNNAGLRGSLSGTALTATLRQLPKASDELGFELFRDESGKLDFAATIKDLEQVIGGFENQDQETRDQLQTLFGDEGIRGIQALSKIIDEIAVDKDKLENDSLNITDKTYAEFVRSAPAKVDKALNNFKTLTETLVNKFLPVIESVSDSLTSAAQKLDKFVEFGGKANDGKTGEVVYKSLFDEPEPITKDSSVWDMMYSAGYAPAEFMWKKLFGDTPQTVTNNNEFNIYPSKGMSEEDIGEIVVRKIETVSERTRRRAEESAYD